MSSIQWFGDKLLEISFYLFAACPTGRYGKNCLFDCECGGSTCDPTNGECICIAGKMGDHCEQGMLYEEIHISFFYFSLVIKIETGYFNYHHMLLVHEH